MRRTPLLLLAVVAGLALPGCASDAQDPGAEQAAAAATGGAATDEALTFVAEDNVYTQAPTAAPAGQVTIELINEGAIVHDVALEELDNAVVTRAPGGQAASGQIALDPGTYTYFCTIAGHRAAGMEGTLTVEG